MKYYKHCCSTCGKFSYTKRIDSWGNYCCGIRSHLFIPDQKIKYINKSSKKCNLIFRGKNFQVKTNKLTLKLLNEKNHYKASGSYVYGFFDPITFKIKYIGKAQNIRNRMNGYQNSIFGLKRRYKGFSYLWLKWCFNKKLVPIFKIIKRLGKYGYKSLWKHEVGYIRASERTKHRLLNVMANPRYSPKGIPRGKRRKYFK